MRAPGRAPAAGGGQFARIEGLGLVAGLERLRDRLGPLEGSDPFVGSIVRVAGGGRPQRSPKTASNR